MIRDTLYYIFLWIFTRRDRTHRRLHRYSRLERPHD
jgi:hypothetical protein